MPILTDLDATTLAAFPDYDGHERIVRIEDAQTGLLAFIGIHNRNLGPALGGCRMRAYASEEEAITDVLRLSRGMTYKNALAGLPLGGGKAVIIADPFRDKTNAMMQAFGQAVEQLAGAYITAEDSGTSEHDMVTISAETSYVVGLPDPVPGGVGGNPSPVTAFGVFSAIKGCAQKRYGSDDLSGVSVAVQGLGAVGQELCRLLYQVGAQLTVTDIRPEVLKEIHAAMPEIKVVDTDEIFDTDAQIFAPCALGAQVNEKTIPRLKCDIICGAANNQLARKSDGEALAKKGVLYAPDYVVNAGGVIAVAYEYLARKGENPFDHPIDLDAMRAHVGQIGSTLKRIFDIADAEGGTTALAADHLAEAIFKDDANRKTA